MTGVVKIIDDPWNRIDGPRPVNITVSNKITISQATAWTSRDHGAREHLEYTIRDKAGSMLKERSRDRHFRSRLVADLGSFVRYEYVLVKLVVLRIGP
jgi:hypothetical protein